MAENVRHGNYSIPNDRNEWLKEKKRETGLPESHFVNKGLDLVIGTEEINAIKLLITPLISFLLGTILFVFGVFFSDALPIPVLIIVLISGMTMIILPWFGLLKAIKVWKKIKSIKTGMNDKT
jgi:hypothetical protein